MINVTKVGKIVIVSGLICFASSPTKVNEVYISGLPQAAKPNYYYQFKGDTTTVALYLTSNTICRWYGETPVAGDTLPVNVIYICV
ncbi:MAG: hypothetical protein IJP13_08685 [Lachnospiraceae bacterium]|nr:hypothetical protein [Lachnospiraceae bacterium]